MLFHFVNCALLAFGPLVAAYRSTRLREYGAFKSCASTASVYMFTQLIKSFLMRANSQKLLKPMMDTQGAGSYSTGLI